jgi:hypothetical protein
LPGCELNTGDVLQIANHVFIVEIVSAGQADTTADDKILCACSAI